jgi:hypothetical protein
MYPDIKQIEKFKPGERAGNTVAPPFPIHFYKNSLFENLPTARKKKMLWTEMYKVLSLSTAHFFPIAAD